MTKITQCVEALLYIVSSLVGICVILAIVALGVLLVLLPPATCIAIIYAIYKLVL